MYTGKLIFSQVMEHLPLHVFHQCVARYQGDFKVQEFSYSGPQFQDSSLSCSLPQGTRSDERSEEEEVPHP